MGQLKKYITLLRAVRRLSLRMLVYMLRRELRNVFALRFPSAYERRLTVIESKLPVIQAPLVMTEGLDSLVAFYCSEYRETIDSICLGSVTLHGKTFDFGSAAEIDWNHYSPKEGGHQMWRVKLAHMGFICPMLVDRKGKYDLTVATLIESACVGTHKTTRGAFNGFWFPYAASHRVLAIGAGLLVARMKGGLPASIDQAIADFLRQNVAFILDNVEHELCNNHVERNLAALCLYFSYVENIPFGVVGKLEKDVSHLLSKTILADGTQIERSPMYQGLSVVSLAIMGEAHFLSHGLRKRLEDKKNKAREAFSILCHPDGEVALFNDSWHGEVPKWDGVPAPDGRSILSDGGYARLSQGGDCCIMDAGPMGPSWNPGHGHADFLSIEVTLGSLRVIVDPGTSNYQVGEERSHERSAAAHNGPAWYEYEPVDFFGSFKVGRTPKAHLVDKCDLQPNEISGVFRDGSRVVGRSVEFHPGLGYLIADIWKGRGQGVVNWLVPASWEMLSREDGYVLHEKESGKDVFIMPQLLRGKATLANSRRARNYGHLEDAWLICFLPKRDNDYQYLLTWVGNIPAPDCISQNGEALLTQLKKLVS